MPNRPGISESPDLRAMYAQLADLYRQMADLLDRAGARMTAHDALRMDAVEAHAAALKARIKEAEESDGH